MCGTAIHAPPLRRLAPLRKLLMEEPRDLVIGVEDVREQRRAYPHAIAGLAKVHRPRIVIDFRWNLEEAPQTGVHLA